MTKKKKKLVKPISPLKPPAVRPIPLSPKLAKPKKKKKKAVKQGKFYVFETNRHAEVEEFGTLVEALEHINDYVLPDYEGDTPDDGEIVVIQGEIVSIDYSVKVEAYKA